MRRTALSCLAVAVGLRAGAGPGRTSCGPGTEPGCLARCHPGLFPAGSFSRALDACSAPGLLSTLCHPGPPGSVSLARFCSGSGQLQPHVPTLSCSPLCSGCSESRFPGTIPAPRCSSSGCSSDLETANSSFFPQDKPGCAPGAQRLQDAAMAQLPGTSPAWLWKERHGQTTWLFICYFLILFTSKLTETKPSNALLGRSTKAAAPWLRAHPSLVLGAGFRQGRASHQCCCASAQLL